MISIYEPNTDYRHDRKSYLIQWDIKRAYYISQIKDVKHSSNIIDLIEVGDYVNGHRVVNEIWGEDDNDLYFEIEGGFNKATCIGEKDIKSIVTKECFQSVSYEV